MRRVRTIALLALTTIIVATACGKAGDGGGGNTSPTTPTPTPPTTPTNRAPVINTMNFTPTFGIQQLTTFTFNATATDPDGDALTYTWDIAGNPFNGTSGSIAFTTGGSGVARLTVSDGKAVSSVVIGATTTDTRSFIVGSMTGQWSGTVDLNTCLPGRTKPVAASLTQSNTVVTGTFTLAEGLCTFQPGTAPTDPAEPGTINATGAVNVRIKIGIFTDVYFRGNMDTTGRRITGGLFGSGHNGTPFVLNKQ